MASPNKNALAYIQRRKQQDPELAELVHVEFDKLQLAREIKALREAKGMSQETLAAKVGTKQPAIARLESGRGVPKIDVIVKIAHALGYSWHWEFQAAPQSKPARRTSPSARRRQVPA